MDLFFPCSELINHAKKSYLVLLKFFLKSKIKVWSPKTDSESPKWTSEWGKVGFPSLPTTDSVKPRNECKRTCCVSFKIRTYTFLIEKCVTCCLSTLIGVLPVLNTDVTQTHKHELQVAILNILTCVNS